MKVDSKIIIDRARFLKSEEGENKEYDRALVELTTELLGKTQEDLPLVAKKLGISKNLWN